MPFKRRFKDKYAGSSTKNASVVRTLFDLFLLFQGCNLSRSCEQYYKRFPLVVTGHNAGKYDFLFLLNAIVEYAMNEVLTITRQDGTKYRIPLLKNPPKTIFKSTNEIVGFTLQFSCPNHDCHCKLPVDVRSEKRLKGEKVTACPFSRKLRFLDTFLFTSAGVEKMVEDLNAAQTIENVPLTKAFSACYLFAQNTGFNSDQFIRMTRGKLVYPYEFGNHLRDLENQTTPPPPSAFQSVLRDSKELDETSWNDFVSTWNLFKIRSLKDLLRLYNILDW